MTKKMLINTTDMEESRMAVIAEGRLIEYDIQMSIREPITGNIYKGIVRKIEKGLQAAFVEYGEKKNGFLPLHDVAPEYMNEKEGKLTNGQEVLVKVLREEKGTKGAMLTTYISLPGRYLVLMPNRQSSGISRKIENEEDRKKLKEIVEQLGVQDNMGLIVRTAGMNRTKQELLRDYQMLLRLWKDIKNKAAKASAPALIYQERDFSVRVFRDYYTSDIDEILVDDVDTYKKMKNYCKAVSPRNVKMIKLYKGGTPIFDLFNIEDQIGEIYQERVDLKSGGYLVINPTEALITIDVNSGRGSSRDIEETAFKTNIEAAQEIARQLRLRDLGGLIVIDFIDMRDRKHISQVEKSFKNALSVDRARIQLARISKFGILELSRQKKQSTIQEISYAACPHCQGRGVRPSIEFLALNTFRKIKSEAVKNPASVFSIILPYEVSDYLLNQKRRDIYELESRYDVSILITGRSKMFWGETLFEITRREISADEQKKEEKTTGETVADKTVQEHQNRKPGRSGKRKNGRPRRNSSHQAIEKQENEGKQENNNLEGDSNTLSPVKATVMEEEVSVTLDSNHSDAAEKEKKKNIVNKFYNLFKL